MANEFLKVEKSLFGKGLSPIELLVYSQIAEFVRNTGDCFMSDAAMAQNFGVSDKTISRAITSLEEKGFIVRHTKASQKGKERHITLATDKLSVGNEIKNLATDKMSNAEQTNCPLPNRQNVLIKDNTKKINIKDNMGIDEIALRSAPSISSIPSTAPRRKQTTEALTKSEMVERFKQEMGF